MLLLLKQKPEIAGLEFCIDFSLDGCPYIEFANYDESIEIRWTKKDTQQNLSCGEVLFNDFVEVEYWLSNCMDHLIPVGEYKGWVPEPDERVIIVQNTDEQTYALSAHDIAAGIKSSNRKLFSVDELKEIHLEVLKAV